MVHSVNHVQMKSEVHVLVYVYVCVHVCVDWIILVSKEINSN